MPINNYYEILTRGSDYIASATINWRKRKAMLNDIWNNTQTVEKKLKALRLLCELNERINQLGDLVKNIRRRQQELAVEAQCQFMILECSNKLCQDGPGGFVMSVKADRFEEDSFHCGNCGCAMRIEGSEEIDEMLEAMGISLSQ